MRGLPVQESDEEVAQTATEYREHSFIVKIWVEEPIDQNDRTIWRGRIIHVPDGKRRYLKSLREIPLFISPYLNAMGVQSPLWERIREWASQSKLFRM